MTHTVKFVFYTGEYPCLCRGNLTVEIDGKIVNCPNVSMVSGGSYGFDDDGWEYTRQGPWGAIFGLPAWIEKDDALVEAIRDVVNANVEQGCCGGCL